VSITVVQFLLFPGWFQFVRVLPAPAKDLGMVQCVPPFSGHEPKILALPQNFLNVDSFPICIFSQDLLEKFSGKFPDTGG
jgi:hypothetical protein